MGFRDRFRNANSWYKKGVELTQKSRYEEALECFDKAIELEPKSEIAWNTRGLLLERLGRYSEAVASFDEAIKFDPEFTLALVK